MVGAHREVSLFWSCAVVCYTLSSLASCATDVLTGQTHHETVRWLLLRLVALIFAVNFLSVAVQCRGLIGPSGILPLQETLSELEENLAYRDRKGLRTPVSSRIMLRWTVLVWRAAGEANVRGAAWCGFALAFGAAVAPLHPWLTAAGFALLYLGWYAYKRGLGTFANLQWDMLLLEAGMLCTLLHLPIPPHSSPYLAISQVPVLELITAIERQATLSMQLGGFMQLIVKLDEGNMRAVRQAWEKHGRPLTVRELLQAEVAAGVQEPTRLKEVCGARRQPVG